MASEGPGPHRVPRRAGARSLLVLAIVLGVGIGPAVAAGAGVGGSAPPVLAASLMIALTATGVAGLVVSAVRWTTTSRRTSCLLSDAGAAEARARFETTGQRASFALAGIELLILAIAAPAVLLLHVAGPQGGPAQDVAAIAVAAVALVALSALVVPTIASQVAWTWRRATPIAEAAVLAGAAPGPRRTILAARTVAVIAWVLATAGAGVTAVLLVGEAGQRLHAVATAYSPDDAAGSIRDDLVDQYVVGDIRCPRSIPDPGDDSTFACRVTSLGRTDTIRVRWVASGFGPGSVEVIDTDHAGLVRVADLPGSVPTAVAPDRDVPAADVVAAVRTQLTAEGWSRSSAAVRDLRCPGIDHGYDGFIRCTIGHDPETERYLDVYPVSRSRFLARTAEIADLQRSPA